MQNSSSVQVHYEAAVVDGGRVVQSLPRRRNLILDAGLNALCSNAYTYANMFEKLWWGTGATPTKRDSGTVTFSRAAGAAVIVASGAFFDALDIGRLLKWDTGEEVYITGFIDSTTAACVAGPALAAAEGTLWYVNRAGLGINEGDTNTLTGLGDASKTGSTITGNTITSRRTFLSPVFGAAKTIRELGWGSNAQVFGTDYLAAPLVVGIGQQLRVTVIWSVTYQAEADIIPVAGDALKAGTLSNNAGGNLWSGVCSMIDVNSGARAGGWYGFALNEPNPGSVRAAPAMENFVQGLGQNAPVAGYDNAKMVAPTILPYVAGSFKTVLKFSYPAGSIVGTVYGLLFGQMNDTRKMSHKLTTPLVVTDTQQLSCTFEISVGRLLVN